jgi:hypothetical protein
VAYGEIREDSVSGAHRSLARDENRRRGAGCARAARENRDDVDRFPRRVLRSRSRCRAELDLASSFRHQPRYLRLRSQGQALRIGNRIDFFGVLSEPDLSNEVVNRSRRTHPGVEPGDPDACRCSDAKTGGEQLRSLVLVEEIGAADPTTASALASASAVGTS